MTMKEVCEYKERTRREKCNMHLTMVRLNYGEIRGFTAKESAKVEIRQKSVFRKGKTHAFTRLWNHRNVPIE